MHSAPAVTVPVGRSRYQALAAAVVWSAAAASCAVWLLQAQAIGWRNGLCVAALLTLAGVLVRAWVAAPTGTLHWDGHAWHWHSGSEERTGQIVLLLDLQAVMVLNFRAEAGSQLWLWTACGADQEQWLGLRRAVRVRPSVAPAVGEMVP